MLFAVEIFGVLSIEDFAEEDVVIEGEVLFIHSIASPRLWKWVFPTTHVELSTSGVRLRVISVLWSFIVIIIVSLLHLK